jgi:hypothetical protein
MAHGCGLTSVRGNRGENYEKGTAGSPKTYKEKEIKIKITKSTSHNIQG